MKYLDVLQDAISAFGEQGQMIVVIEELAELQKELTKMLRGQGTADNLAEEMADVQIMLDQLEIIFGNRGAVAAWQTEKMKRLAERITEHNAAWGRS